MKNSLSILVLFLVISSCSEDDQVPKVDEIPYATISVLEGNGQNGAPGQFLEDSIKMLIKFAEGAPNSSLILKLSDDSGSVMHQYVGDTILIKWKLGCVASSQSLMVGVCKPSGTYSCMPINIAEIYANAVDPIPHGLVGVCTPMIHFSSLLTSENTLAISNDYSLYRCVNLASSIWKEITPENNVDYFGSESFSILKSGDIVFNSSEPQILRTGSDDWEVINLPMEYSGISMAVSGNGYYLMVGGKESRVFISTNGLDWKVLLDISETLDYYTVLHDEIYPQDITIDGESAYIVTQEHYIIEVDLTTNHTEVHRLSEGYWEAKRGLGWIKAEVRNDYMYISPFSSNQLIVANLLDNSESVYNLEHAYELVKTSDKIYVIDAEFNLTEWIGNTSDLINHSVTPPYFRSTHIGLYNESPVGIGEVTFGYNSQNMLFYYNN